MLLGALAAAGLAGFSLMQSMAPTAGGAIQTCLTDDSIAAKQRVLSNNPVQELSESALSQARIRGLITNETFLAGMKKNGYNTTRSNLAKELSKNLATIETLIAAFYKGDIDYSTYIKKCNRQGMDEKDAYIHLQSTRNAPSAELLVIDLWRGVITKEVYYKKMKQLGYIKEDADLLLQAQYFLPNHEDLIRFQVRDVYREDIVKKYGYDEEFPENILPDAKKIGMTREVMLNYWKAHWQLPSPTQAYEMLHRLHPEVLAVTAQTYDYPAEFMRSCETVPETIEELLKVDDYPNYWRKRLMAISYHALTRVDLRRVYQLGLITDEYVVATLREHGYSSYDANKLLEFFKEIKQGKPKKLTQSKLIKGYNYGYIKRDELKNELRNMNYSEEDIEVVLNVNKQTLEEKDFKDLLNTLQYDYQIGNLSEDEIRAKLGIKGLKAAKIDLIVKKFKQSKRKATKLPPLKDIHHFYSNKQLDELEYTAALTAYGLPRKFIKLYIEQHKPT